jgi:hypothetical protein
MVTRDIMVALWIGTQADDAFPEAWNTDALQGVPVAQALVPDGVRH